jgi:small subunit ribosomal protein S8e
MTTKKGRKISGKKYAKQRKKKKYEITNKKRIVRIGIDRRKTKRIRGGNLKTFMTNAKFVNIKSKNKISKGEIKNVLETPSNSFLARQNIITKGTIVETNLGKVRITNRPSQDGVANGVLVE